MPSREERKEASRLARRRDDRSEASHPEPEPTRRAKRRGGTAASRPHGMEHRYREGVLTWAHIGSNEWRRSWKWYATEARRDQAMAALNRNDRISEYRPIDRRRPE